MKRLITPIISVIIFSLVCPALLIGETMEWAGNFGAIDLGVISGLASQSLEDSSTATLNTDGIVDITVEAADRNGSLVTNTTGSSPYDTLTTKYKIEFDGYAGTFTDYSTFLSSPATVTHPAGNSIVITLSVQVSTVLYEVPDLGAYSATQILTATWVSQ